MKKTINRVLNFILRQLDKFTNKQYGRSYVFCFNLLNLIFLKKQKIYFKKNSYYLKIHNEKNISWKFNQSKLGTMAYRDGLFERKQILKKVYLLKNINFYDNDLIVDCGANNGDFYLCFDKYINYIGIEPSPMTFENLKYNIRNQRLINKAIWNRNNSSHDFYLSDNFGDSSVIKIKNYTKKIIIETCTLDSILSNEKKIKLIKIEAEGAEPEALYGLKESINKVEYIVVDVGFERGINEESTMKQCINYLLKNNFEIIDFRLERLVFLFKNMSI